MVGAVCTLSTREPPPLPSRAQVVGDRFTESLYDIHIHLGGSTILEAGDHALGGGALSKLLPAKAIMATKLRTVRETEEVDRLRGMLRESRHSGFPVVQADGSRVFVGFISREKLVMLLARQAELQAKAGAAAAVRNASLASSACDDRFSKRRNSLPVRTDAKHNDPHGFDRGNGDSSADASMRGGSVWGGSVTKRLGARRSSLDGQHSPPLMREKDGTATPPEAGAPAAARPRRRVASRDVHMSELLSLCRPSHAAKPPAKRQQHSRPTIDLLPHCDRAPFTVHELLPLYMVTRLFTSMGLRHLCVLDGRSRVAGVITRKDFAKSHSAMLQDLSSYAHLSEGGVVQKRMLEASYQERFAHPTMHRVCNRMCQGLQPFVFLRQVELVKAQATAHGNERPGLRRSISEPSVLQLAAAHTAAERVENGAQEFRRHRAHSISVNKKLALILRGHPCLSSDAAGDSNGRPAGSDAGTKGSPVSR